MNLVRKCARPIVFGLVCLAAGSALAAKVFVGDKGGATVLNLPAIHEFQSTTGDQSQLVSADGIWTDPLDMAADRTTGDVIVLDLGAGAVTHPPRLLRFDGESGVRTEVAAGHDLWIDPLAVTVDRNGDIIVLDGGGGWRFLSPRCSGLTARLAQRSVIAAGHDLWHDPVDLVADPTTGDIFVLDLGGAVAFDPPAIRRFDGLTGAASIVAEGSRLVVRRHADYGGCKRRRDCARSRDRGSAVTTAATPAIRRSDGRSDRDRRWP